MKNIYFNKGSIIILVLLVTMVLLFYISALIGINKHNLLFSTYQRDYLAAKYAAKAGVNHLAYKFAKNPNFGLTEKKYESIDEKTSFVVYFDKSIANGLYSINNLCSPTDHPSMNFEGKIVKPRTADIVVLGTSRLNSNNPITCKIHVIFRRTFDSDISIGSDGDINLTGDIEIKGVRSMLELDQEMGGGIHSNSDNSLSISWTPGSGSGFKLGNGARITTTGGVSSNLNSYSPITKTSPVCLPKYSIIELIERKSNMDNPPGILYNASNDAFYSPNMNLLKEYYLSGNLVVNGDINLSDASLYVKGNLTVNGGIKGFGGIFVSGNVDMKGGNSSVITNQANSAAIFSDGNVSVIGLSASGYLDSLSLQYPDIAYKYKKFKSAQKAVIDFIKYTDSYNKVYNHSIIEDEFGEVEAVHFDNFAWEPAETWKSMERLPLGYHDDCWPECRYCDCNHAILDLHWASQNLGFYSNNNYGSWDFENPEAASANTAIPYKASTSAIIPGLINSIKTSMGAQLDNDIAGQKVLKALYELAWINRHMPEKDDTMSSFVELTPEDKTCLEFLKYRQISRDSIPFGQIIADGRFPEFLTSFEVMDIYRNIYLANDPLSPSWCDKSYFQGIVYANGNITAAEKITIYGTLISQKAINLNNASIVYCQDYMNLTGKTCPLELVLYREF
jgi:hypothetical protein